jgi:hypothetical protein
MVRSRLGATYLQPARGCFARVHMHVPWVFVPSCDSCFAKRSSLGLETIRVRFSCQGFWLECSLSLPREARLSFRVRGSCRYITGP